MIQILKDFSKFLSDKGFTIHKYVDVYDYNKHSEISFERQRFNIYKYEHIVFEATDFSSFFHPQSLTGDFEKIAETLFLNHNHMRPELYELGEKLLSL